MTGGIVWEEPPATAQFAGQKQGAYAEFAAALRQHQGKWAIMPGTRKTPDSAKGTAQNVRRGVVKGFTKGEFETAVEGTTIYVRWIGRASDLSAADEPVEPVTPDDALDGAPDVVDAPAADSRRIRAWGLANGYDLPERGRMPQAVLDAYARAHASYSQPAGETAEV